MVEKMMIKQLRNIQLRERERERERDGIFHCRSRKYLSSLFGSLENCKKMMREIQLQKRDKEKQKENWYVCW